MKESRLLAVFLVIAGLAAAQAAKLDSAITGVLENTGGQAVLKAGGKAYRLATDDQEDAATLADERWAGHTLRVEGRETTPGTLQVERFFGLRDGKLYRLAYYCEICNITQYRPGPCMCCQQPVEPREIPNEP